MTQPKKLEEMTPEEAAPIMEAWRTGEKLEVLDKASWERSGLYLARDQTYRIAVTQDEIPWDILPDGIKWTARDENGKIWGFPAEPYLSNVYWCGADFVNLSSAIKINPGTCHWTGSLQKRPESD